MSEEKMVALNDADLEEVAGGKSKKDDKKDGKKGWDDVKGRHCPNCQARLKKKGNTIICIDKGHYWIDIDKSDMTYANMSGTDIGRYR